MPYCVVKKCKNTSSNIKKNTGLSFHRFPRAPILLSKWVDALRKNRKDNSWAPSTYCVVCSAHFQESDLYITNTGLRRLSKNAIPTKNLFNSVEACTVIASDHLHSNSSHHSTASRTAKTSTDSPQLRSTPTCAVLQTSSDILSPNLTSIDTDSNLETPQEVHLKNQLRKHQVLRVSTKKKLKCLQQQCRRLKKSNMSLKSNLKNLENKNLANIDKQLSENAVLAELFHNLYMRCKGNKLKFRPALKKFCLTLNFYSPRAYEYVRKTFNTCLSQRKTLAKWYSCIKEKRQYYRNMTQNQDV